MKQRRLLYLPVETQARELLGKIFLAARAVERGWIVVLGDKSVMRSFMRERVPGTYCEISIPDKKASRLEEIHKAGHRIVNLCEESILYTDGHDYCARKIGAEAFRWTDRLLLPGERNASDIESHYPDFAHKLAITGNPRFDVLAPGLRRVYEERADAIRRRFGQFLLVNTNFGRANPQKVGEDAVEKLVARGFLQEGSEADFIRRQMQFKRRQMRGLQTLLEDLSRSGAVEKIILRPHPVENHDLWREWAKPLNIDLRYEGSANEWILAAQAVLHPGCTTGVEGLLLDRPVFSYVPDPESEFINQPDRVSQWVSNAGELVDGLNRFGALGQESLRNALALQREQLRCYVANIDPPLAADRILDELDSLDTPTARADQIIVWPSAPRRFLTGMRGLLHRFGPGAIDVQRKRQKFPGASESEIRAPLACWVEAGALLQVPQIARYNDRLWVLH
jgi:surface carbohydrate biosynthesis protein